MNYPQCDDGYNWIFVNKPLKIKKTTYQNLFKMLKPENIIDGNYVIANQAIEDKPISKLENKFETK